MRTISQAVVTAAPQGPTNDTRPPFIALADLRPCGGLYRLGSGDAAVRGQGQNAVPREDKEMSSVPTEHDDEYRESVTEQSTAFEKDTLHRMLSGAARYWVINHYLHKLRIPESAAVYFAYPNGPAGFDWGNALGPDGPDKPLRGKRVRITLEIEDS